MDISQKTFLKHGITPDIVELLWPFRITENNAAIVGACVDFYAMNILLPPITSYPSYASDRRQERDGVWCRSQSKFVHNTIAYVVGLVLLEK